MRTMGTADLRLRAVTGIRKLASQLDDDHPMLGTAEHLRDAARAVERGNHIGAGRHLEAAMHTLAPLSLYRHGINDDEAIAVGKRNMDAINRHSLLVKDLGDAAEHNAALAEHRDGQRAIEEGHRTERANARAAQAQALAAASGVSKEALAASNQPGRVIGLVGPKGYEHGWKYVGPSGGKGYVSKLSYPGRPGGAGHLQAIVAVGKKYNPMGELRPNPVAGPLLQIIDTAMHHAAASVAARDMKSARLHLEQARRAAHRLGPDQEGEVLGVISSLADVPKGATDLYVPRPRTAQGRAMESRLGSAYQVGDSKVPDFSGVIRKARGLSNTYPESTWPAAATTPTTSASGTRAVLRAAISAQRAAEGRLGTGPRSTAGTAPARRTTGRSVSLATGPMTVTTGSGRESATATPSSPNSRSWKSGTAGPRGQEPWPGTSGPPSEQSRKSARAGTGPGSLELSARTAMLTRTPAPRGKPGGPGLYGIKGMGHSDYFNQVVKALIEKRGMPKDKAYKVAYGALRRWRRGGGNVHPEVRAAATGSLASEAAKGARARAAHGHSSGDPLTRIDLAVAAACRSIELVGPKGYTHNWVFHGRPGLSPEDRANELSHHIAHNTLPAGVPGHTAHLEAARLHSHAANLSSNPATVAHHQRMAGHHAKVARQYGSGGAAGSGDYLAKVLGGGRGVPSRAARQSWARSHAGSPDMGLPMSNQDRALELAFDPSAHPRAAAGSAAGGQFTAGGAAPAAAKQPGKGTPAQHKAALLKQAGALDQQANGLSRRLRAIMLAMRIAARQRSTSRSKTPAVRGKAGSSNNPAPRKKGAPARKGPPAARRGPSGPPGGGISSHLHLAGQIVALRTKIKALRAQAVHLRAQAAKL